MVAKKIKIIDKVLALLFQTTFHFLKFYTLCFRNKKMNPAQLKHHHHTKNSEYVFRFQMLGHDGEKQCDESGKEPMGKTSKCLSICPIFIGKYLTDQYPDHCTLTNTMGSDESKNKYRNQTFTSICKCKCNSAKRNNVSKGSDIQQGSSA